MTCPYCHKRVGDVPDHLGKSPKCHEKHAESLRRQFRAVVAHENQKRSGQQRKRGE